MAAQGNLFGALIAAAATPTFFYQLPDNGAGDPIAYWSANIRIGGHETQEANVHVYVATDNDPNNALRLDGAKIEIGGSFSLECLIRSPGDCFFIKSDVPLAVHVEGVCEVQPV